MGGLIRVGPGRYVDPYTRLPVVEAAAAPVPEPAPAPVVERRRAPAEPATGPIVMTVRVGMLHRLQPDGNLHPRCAGGRAVAHRPVDEVEAVSLAAGATWRLCRYCWCFRDWVESVGINPEVGHVSRSSNRGGRPGPRPGARCDGFTVREGLRCGRVEGHGGYCRPEGRA